MRKLWSARQIDAFTYENYLPVENFRRQGRECGFGQVETGDQLAKRCLGGSGRGGAVGFRPFAPLASSTSLVHLRVSIFFFREPISCPELRPHPHNSSPLKSQREPTLFVPP